MLHVSVNDSPFWKLEGSNLNPSSYTSSSSKAAELDGIEFDQTHTISDNVPPPVLRRLAVNRSNPSRTLSTVHLGSHLIELTSVTSWNNPWNHSGEIEIAAPLNAEIVSIKVNDQKVPWGRDPSANEDVLRVFLSREILPIQSLELKATLR